MLESAAYMKDKLGYYQSQLRDRQKDAACCEQPHDGHDWKQAYHHWHPLLLLIFSW